MANLDRALLRSLAGWSAEGVPVSSVYLDVDGRRHPRRQDYERRAEELVERLKELAPGDRDGRLSVCNDADRILRFIRELDRGGTRGVAVFSASRVRLWEQVLLPRPVRDRATVAAHPHVLPLEALVETYQSFCTVIVDREKARIFLSRMGQVEEQTGVFDEVPGRHDQGGWAQARYQRHIEEIVGHHLKRVADVLLRFFKRARFDHLILAGPEEIVPEFERHLHDYLRRRVALRTHLSMNAPVEEVLERSIGVEEALESARERRVLERLAAGDGPGRHAVTGLEPVLAALNENRVDTLVVPSGMESEGMSCSRCGRLAGKGRRCRTCGGALQRVPDLVESAVAAALRQNSRVETLTLTPPSSPQARQIGALLRY
jgi:peptide chain release factor subunit 1